MHYSISKFHLRKEHKPDIQEVVTGIDKFMSNLHWHTP